MTTERTSSGAGKERAWDSTFVSRVASYDLSHAHSTQLGSRDLKRYRGETIGDEVSVEEHGRTFHGYRAGSKLDYLLSILTLFDWLNHMQNTFSRMMV